MKKGKIIASIFSLICAFAILCCTAFTGCSDILNYVNDAIDEVLSGETGNGGSGNSNEGNGGSSTSDGDNSDDADNNDDGDNSDDGGENTDDDDDEQSDSSAGGNSDISAGELAEITSADLSIHFLELGNKYAGDCVLIKCGDTEVLIDAGSRTGSATTLKSYIDNYCTDGVLEYVIATHSDQDHIAAFVGNKSGSSYTGLLYQYEVGTLIKFDQSTSTSQIYTNFLTAVDYVAEQGATVYTASQCYDETDGAKRQYYLDEAQTISINILYNYYYYNVSSDQNNHSVVMLLTQEVEGEKLNYLFTGDLEEEGEKYLVEYYNDVPEGYNTEYNVLPEVELYKAGHHGSKTSSTGLLMAKIKPKNIAVCCCAGSPEYTTNSENTFPTQAMISNVCKYTENIYVTTAAVIEDFENKKYSYESMNGNIVFYYSGELKLYCSNNTTKLKDTEWFLNNRIWA